MQDEALGLDSLRAFVHARGNMYLKARVARSSRHRPSVEQERKVLVGDVQKASGGGDVSGRH